MLQHAVAHHQAGRLAEADELYQQVLQAMPSQPDALHLSGVMALQRGNIDSAVDLIRRAIEANASVGIYHLSLGNALQTNGLLDEAIASYRQAILLKPDYAEAFSNLGAALKTLNRLDEAVASYRQALLLKPDMAEAHSNLGNVFRMQGRLDEAVACHRQALLLKPDMAEAYGNLGTALQAQGRLDEAVASYRQGLLLKPDDAEAYSNLGTALLAQGLPDEAIACCRKALQLKPDFSGAYRNLGNALLAKCQADEAIASYRQALLIKPDDAETLCNLGNALKDQGRLDEAMASYRQALILNPDSNDAFINLIFSLDLAVGPDTGMLQAERRRWSEAHTRGFVESHAMPAFPNDRDPERRLRIGYVSADFRQHSAAVVFGAMLTKFNPATFEVFAYSNSVTEDSYTRLFRQSVSHWRKIVGQSDAAVADQIRKDGIDLLVDLSGYTAGNRLRVFARKPAPIQITAWGYIGGTGMTAMDAFLADPIVVPPEEKSLYAEEIRELPNAVSAFFPEPFPPVNALPAQAVSTAGGGESITFGSFNRLCKISAEAYRVWAQVLQAMPGSRMILKTAELDAPATRERVLAHFTRAGIDPARILLQGKTPWQEHLAAFNQIDIAIDPFPHGGGVTTLEGLMMGVPVVTLRWPTLPGRVSASILTTLGLTDWIAETPEQYVDIAIRKARDLSALAGLRQQLRPRFMASIIGDTAAYASVVEQEYRKLWREWCAANPLRA